MNKEIFQLVKTENSGNNGNSNNSGGNTKVYRENLDENIFFDKFWNSNCESENIKIFTSKFAHFMNKSQSNLRRGVSTQAAKPSMPATANFIPFGLNHSGKNLCSKFNDLNSVCKGSETPFCNAVFPSSPSSPKKKVKKGDEDHKVINLERIFRKKDKRTTIMIRNIPNKYKLKTLLDEISSCFENKFDLFYLPVDYTNNCNLGFAFINFTDPLHIIAFYDFFKGKKWKCFNSEKVCELAYAKYQGKKELTDHFARGNVMNFTAEDKKPLILNTPTTNEAVTVPIKYLNAFLEIYPNSCVTLSKDMFCIESFYKF